jgi:hypothetical protein
VEARAVENGAVFALAGRNYFFDSKGPRSGFSTQVITGGPLPVSSMNFQSVGMGGVSLIFNGLACYKRVWTVIDPETVEPSIEWWEKIHEFGDVETSGYNRYCWTKAYVSHGSYVCHPLFGIFKYNGDSLIEFNPPGLPENPLAIGEVAGRLIIMGQYAVAWSNSFNADDLTPELGGAGFQVINERVPGNPLALTSYQGGFLTWTDQGVMSSEFIGGEAVFRHDRVITDQLILNPGAWTQMADGSIVLVTQQGLFRSSVSGGLQQMTPIFNEYFRSEIAGKDSYYLQLEYINEHDHLYIQILDGSSEISRTYVLSVSLDKWGEFSESHLGICRWTGESNDYGYVGIDGTCYRFTDSFFSESEDGSLKALGSEIELGYFNPSSGAPYADITFEWQGVLISGIEKRTAAQEASVIYEDWGFNIPAYNIGFYLQDEDWNRFGVADFDEDWNDFGAQEDWNDPGDSIDYNDSVAGARDFDWNNSGPMEDWGATPDGGVDTSYIVDWGLGEEKPDEDWNADWLWLNRMDYGIEVRCSLDGYEQDNIVTPRLAVEKGASDFFTMMSYGHHHRMVISANQVNQKFHVKTIEITVNSYGRIA